REFELIAEIENFHFDFELEPGHYPVKVALTHFENAINNLLDNAKKYANQPEVVLKAYVKDGSLYISISDNGRGISAREKQLVFKKFYRVSEGNLHRVKGYGLGLSYVEEVIKRHKGRISLESELEKGTKITVNIPLRNAE